MRGMTDTSSAQSKPDTPASAPRLGIAMPREYGAINGLGLWTLYKREVGRFLNVWRQTLVAPIVTTLLYITVFQLAFGGGGRAITEGDFANIPFGNFLAPGLLVMAILQNAFANTSSSLVISKVQGTQVDFMMPPLNATELTIGFVTGVYWWRLWPVLRSTYRRSLIFRLKMSGRSCGLADAPLCCLERLAR